MPEVEIDKDITTIEQEDDSFDNDDLFNITTWGMDISFRQLATMYKDSDIEKPSLQRNYRPCFVATIPVAGALCVSTVPILD